MLYLDYAKKMDNGFILNFFADNVTDIEEVSNGKPFVTKNGTNYGAPLASSTVVITAPDKTKLTYVMNESGKWKEYKEESAPHAVTNYNLSAFAFSDYGILEQLKEYLEDSKGVFGYDSYVEYMQAAFGTSNKQSNGYYIWNGGEIQPEESFYIFGKVKDGATYFDQPRTNMDMTKKYLVELRPRLFENFSRSGEIIRNDMYYSWICKVVPYGDDFQYTIINEDCELTDEEVNSFYPNSESVSAEDPKNPEIFIVLTQSAEENMGAVPLMMATKKDCEYFSLCVTEM